MSDYLEEKNDFYEGVCKKQEQDRAARKLLVADLAILEAHEMGIDWFAFLAACGCTKKIRRVDGDMLEERGQT